MHDGNEQLELYSSCLGFALTSQMPLRSGTNKRTRTESALSLHPVCVDWCIYGQQVEWLLTFIPLMFCYFVLHSQNQIVYMRFFLWTQLFYQQPDQNWFLEWFTLGLLHASSLCFRSVLHGLVGYLFAWGLIGTNVKWAKVQIRSVLLCGSEIRSFQTGDKRRLSVSG